MASFDSDTTLLLFKQPSSTPHSTTITLPHRLKFRLRRRGRRQLPIVQLGGGKKPRGRGFFLTRLFRGARLKWLKLCVFKRLRQYYKTLIKELIEASASVEAYQQRVLMETSLAVPTMGISFSNFHGGSTLRNPRSIFM